MLERDLYEPVDDYLQVRFSASLRPLYGEFKHLTSITATAGGNDTGKWSKPDLCLVALWRHKFSPTWQLDLHGFEVKPEHRCTIESVHEALSHTSHVNYAHLVWHSPKWQDADVKCQAIADRCQRHGVGLITMRNECDASSYVIRVPAKRVPISGDATDEFIETRFQPGERHKLIEWLEKVR